MRLIDADAFDRALANHEFTAALNEAVNNDRAFESIPMLYSTQSFRDVMKCRQTIDAIPVEWLESQIVPFSDKLKDEVRGVFNATIKEMIYRWQKEQEAR